MEKSTEPFWPCLICHVFSGFGSNFGCHLLCSLEQINTQVYRACPPSGLSQSIGPVKPIYILNLGTHISKHDEHFVPAISDLLIFAESSLTSKMGSSSCKHHLPAGLQMLIVARCEGIFQGPCATGPQRNQLEMTGQPTSPKVPPLRNKGLIAGLIQGNHWIFISPDHEALFPGGGAGYVKQGRHL